MEYAANEVLCNCKHVTMADVDRVLHQCEHLSDVEREFEEVQRVTACSTGCGGCHDKILAFISSQLSG